MTDTSDDAMRVRVPGDKSIAHRVVMLAALADGTSRMRGIPAGRDVASTLDCLRQLGVQVRRDEGDTLIDGAGLHGLTSPTGDLDCGNSGTTLRLLTGILAGQPFDSRLTGDASLRKRPMERVMEPLRMMGARFPGDHAGRAPFRVVGKRPLQRIAYELPVASAQVKSAILLAGLFAEGETEIREPVRSRDHTERLLRARVEERTGTRVITITPPDTITPLDMAIPGDPSSAAFIAAAALVTGMVPAVLERVSVNPTRIGFMKVLRRLGASLQVQNERTEGGEPVADVVVEGSQLTGELVIDSEIPSLIDEIPILSVVCACSGIPFTVSNARELRHKESDRIAVLVSNLRTIGCDVEEHDDGFASRPKNGLIGASISTHGDHRIAMAFGVAGLVIDGLTVDDRECADVSFPGFWDLLNRFRR